MPTESNIPRGKPAGRAGIVPRGFGLDPEALKARAAAATGLSVFGALPLDDGLAVLCRAIDEEAGLDARETEAMAASIVATLCERLRVEQAIARHPEIVDVELAPPLLVIGLPRSGTTAISQLLSTDPAARSIRRWELNKLTPPPDASAPAPDPRIAATRAAFEARDKAMPGLRAMLPIDAEDPSEHGVILAQTFRNLHWPSLNTIPSYSAWLARSDMDPAFEYLRRVLQMLQWKSPAGHWNVKNPVDSFAIDSLLRIFPEGHVVWVHRDPADTIPSVCSLLCSLREAAGQTFDHQDFGRYILEFEAGVIDRAMERRETASAEHRITDVTNRELSRDPVATLRRVYAAAGLDFTAAFERSLVDRMRERPRGQHGKHSYTAEQFGLDTPTIRDRFSRYITRFDVPLGAG